MKFQDSKTYHNLARAYAGECQARTRYEFIEYGARMQGYSCLAEVVDKVVYNEFNHARMFYTYLQQDVKKQIDNIDISAGYPFKEKWDLTDNLRLAAEDEKTEAEEVYPEFVKIAKEEGYDDVADLFKMVIEVEKSHQALFEELHKQMKDGSLYKKKVKVTWKCSGCGHTESAKEAWEECPLCKEKQGAVILHLENA